MLTIRYSSRFKKDYKVVKKRGYDTRLLEEVLDIKDKELILELTRTGTHSDLF
jgi:mRNA interferase YafQ